MKLARQIAICVALAAMTLCAWFVPLDSTATQQVDAGLKRALITFASARLLNAAISAAQGTEFSVQPLGVGVQLSLGQILHPVNNLVEQFAHLMLIASMAFGVEAILIRIGAHWLISLALTTVAIGWAYFFLRNHSSPAWLTRILVVLLMARFAIPIVVIGSDTLFHQFMATEYIASQKVLETTSAQVESLSSDGHSAQVESLSSDRHSEESKSDQHQSLAEKLKQQLKGVMPTVPRIPSFSDIKSGFKNLKQSVEQITERVIKLMVIFLLQTLLLPIFLLWVLWGVAKGTFEVPPQAARFMAPRPNMDTSVKT